MKIVIAGGRGFIGNYLVNKYRQFGNEVLVISRSALIDSDVSHILWSDETGLVSAIDHAELLINMAGKSVDCRYTAENKKTILDSRLDTTIKLGEIVKNVKHPPKLWINSSTATIYRHAEDRPMTEANGEIGSGFSVDVATKWEKAFFNANTPATRKLALRTAIVLGNGGGAYPQYKWLTEIGLGGKQGKGTQMVSFVHIEDLFRAIEYCRNNTELDGIINVSSPSSVKNSTFMSIFRKAHKKDIGIPVTAWMLAVGAFFLRTETELILKSRWVLSERLENHGFKFRFEALARVIQNLNS